VIEDTEQQLLVRRILRNRRQQYDPASKERLVAACCRCGGASWMKRSAMVMSKLARWSAALMHHGVPADLEGGLPDVRQRFDGRSAARKSRGREYSRGRALCTRRPKWSHAVLDGPAFV